MVGGATLETHIDMFRKKNRPSWCMVIFKNAFLKIGKKFIKVVLYLNEQFLLRAGNFCVKVTV